MWPRHRIDVGAGEAVRALARCALPGGRSGEDSIRRLAGTGAIPCRSLRSGFHLLLTELALAPGDEVLFSAITHPDMPRIAALHGLRPVPVDLERTTLAPAAAVLERALGPRTRMIVVAHLFGGLVDLAPLRTLADRAGILLVDDHAQALADPADLGPGLADVSLYSFGMIKTATALGGGVIVARDRALAERLGRRHRSWPLQARRQYARRAAVALALVVVQNRRVYGAVAATARAARSDLDGLLGRLVRGFPPGDDAALMTALEKRPAPPLVATMAARLQRWPTARLGRRSRVGARLDAALAPAALPGRQAVRRTHWLYPVTPTNPAALVAALRSGGFDASRSTTSIAALPAPAERPDLDPEVARSLLERVVFVPVYPELDDATVQRLAALLTAHAVVPESGHAPAHLAR